MTHIELRDLLVNRIGWFNEPGSAFAVDTANQTTQSGRVYQDEYPSVTLTNIIDTMNKKPVGATEFNAHLLSLKKRAIILVLSDVLETTDLDDDFITGREDILDNAISKRMAILVGESILSSTRSNRTELLTKEFTQQLFFEINGSEGNPNFPNYIGMKSRYGQEVTKAKHRLGHQKMLDVNTLKLPNYENTDSVELL